MLTLFHYDSVRGEFTWLLPTANRVKVDDQAGCLNTHGRVTITFLGKTFFRSHLVWLMETGLLPPASLEIDHKDRTRSNDAPSNLRLATSSQNKANSTRTGELNATGHKNIYKKGPRRLIVRVIHSNRRVEKVFYCIEDAVEFRNQAVKELHGEFLG